MWDIFECMSRSLLRNSYRVFLSISTIVKYMSIVRVSSRTHLIWCGSISYSDKCLDTTIRYRDSLAINKCSNDASVPIKLRAAVSDKYHFDHSFLVIYSLSFTEDKTDLKMNYLQIKIIGIKYWNIISIFVIIRYLIFNLKFKIKTRSLRDCIY